MNRKSQKGLAFPALVLGAPTASPTEDPAAAAGLLVDPPHEPEPAFEPAMVTLSDDPLLDLTEALNHAATAAPATKTKARKSRASASAPTETFAEAASGPRPARLPFWARWAYPGAAILAGVWSGLLIAFCLAYRNQYGAFEYTPFPPAVFGGLALLPAAFMLLGAFVLRQAAKLSLETGRARTLAEELAIPAALAVDQAGGAADAVRREVARAAEAGEAAEQQLMSLRRSLADESDRLIAATEAAERVARALTDSLSRERTSMVALSSSLELQIGSMSEALERQTQLVGDTSDLAATQLQEAEASLAARTADLTAVASAAGEAAELASEALGRQTERLETVGALVGERLETLGEQFGRGHSRLADLAVQLQADQQALADRLEAQRLSALATAAETSDSLHAMTETASQAGARLRDLVAEAEARLHSAGQTIQGEQAALDARARAGLSLFRDAVTEERRAIELEARTALADLAMSAAEQRRATAADLAAAEASVAAQAEAARAQVEQLGDAAFALGQKTDQAFEARITSARRSIEQAAALVEEAGRQSMDRIDTGVAAARTTLQEVEAMLEAVDERIAAVPAETQARAERVRASVEASLSELSANARRIAAESEAMDTALQDRVRRNYEMLADALKTMGKVAEVTEQAAAQSAAQSAAQAAAQAPVQPAAPPPMARPVEAAPSMSPRAAEPILAPRPAAPAPQPTLSREPITLTPEMRAPEMRSHEPRAPSPAPFRPEAPPPQPASLRPAALSASEAGLRPRLRLTAEDEAPAPRPAMTAPTASAAPNPAPRAERPPPVTHETLDPFVRPRPSAAARDVPQDTRAWTWKDLLSSIDEPPIDDEVLAERLISEIEALGLDAVSLLPLSQIDALAAAMQKGDAERVREAVRALAPGAVRRLSRRVLTDKVLRAQADRYVRRYEDLIHDSAQRDTEGFMTAALLGSEPGRAFLLFDAAVGELH